MSRIRGRGNERTEKSFISWLRKEKISGWRRHQTIHFNQKGLRKNVASDGTVFKVQVRPDFLFPKQKIACFVDGCFWHGCPSCYRRPRSRKKFWDTKILRNLERDKFQTRQLKRMDWRVVRIRECSFQNPARRSFVLKRLGLWLHRKVQG